MSRSPLFRHLHLREVKKKIDTKNSLLEELNALMKEEREIIKNHHDPQYSNWRASFLLEGGMTTDGIMATSYPSEGDTDLDTIDASTADSYEAYSGGSEGLKDTAIVSSGSGEGKTGGFDLGQDYLSFDGDDEPRYAALAPIDASKFDQIVVTGIRGNDNNGGEDPDEDDSDLVVYYQLAGEDTIQRLDYIGTSQQSGIDYIIIPKGDDNSGLQEYKLSLPSYARAEGIRFILYQAVHSGTGFDNYGITQISYRRTTPLTVFISLDSPEASSFMRLGSSPTTLNKSKKEREKELREMLAASRGYTDVKFGQNFPGSETPAPGEEDPTEQAKRAPALGEYEPEVIDYASMKIATDAKTPQAQAKEIEKETKKETGETVKEPMKSKSFADVRDDQGKLSPTPPPVEKQDTKDRKSFSTFQGDAAEPQAAAQPWSPENIAKADSPYSPENFAKNIPGWLNSGGGWKHGRPTMDKHGRVGGFNYSGHPGWIVPGPDAKGNFNGYRTPGYDPKTRTGGTSWSWIPKEKGDAYIAMKEAGVPFNGRGSLDEYIKKQMEEDGIEYTNKKSMRDYLKDKKAGKYDQPATQDTTTVDDIDSQTASDATMLDQLMDKLKGAGDSIGNALNNIKDFFGDYLTPPAAEYSTNIAKSILQNKPITVKQEDVPQGDIDKFLNNLEKGHENNTISHLTVSYGDPIPYADENIYTDKNGNIKSNIGPNGEKEYYQKGQTQSFKVPGGKLSLGYTNPLAAAGEAQVQVVYPTDGSEPYLLYTDHAYHNTQSDDPGEVPDPFKKVFSGLVHAFAGHTYTKSTGSTKELAFDTTTPNTGAMSKYPPNIRGDVKTEIKIPWSKVPDGIKKRAETEKQWRDQSDMWPGKSNPFGMKVKKNAPQKDFGSVASVYGGKGVDASTLASVTSQRTQRTQRKGRKKKKPTTTMAASYKPQGSLIMEKRKLKNPNQFFNSDDIKPDYPKDPPPDMVDGKWHPDLVDSSRKAERFNKLDPASAKAMPKTGDPKIDAKVEKAKNNPDKDGPEWHKKVTDKIKNRNA